MVRITNTHTNSSIRKWVLLAKEQSRKRHTGNSNNYSLQMMMMMSVAKALWVLGSFGLFSLLACHSMVAAEARTLCGSKNTHIAAAKDKQTHIQAGGQANRQPAIKLSIPDPWPKPTSISTSSSSTSSSLSSSTTLSSSPSARSSGSGWHWH